MKRYLTVLALTATIINACKKEETTVIHDPNPVDTSFRPVQPGGNTKKSRLLLITPPGSFVSKDSAWPNGDGHTYLLESNTFPITANNAALIFPGAAFKGSTVTDGIFTPLTGYTYKPASVGATLTYTNASTLMDPPSASATQLFLKRFFQGNATYPSNGISWGISGDLYYDRIQVAYADQSPVPTGATDSTGGGFYMSYEQRLYSVYMDIPKDGQLFTTPVSEATAQDNPLYVSDIKYGRRGILVFTLKYSTPFDLAALRIIAGKASRHEGMTGAEMLLLGRTNIRYYAQHEGTGGIMTAQTLDLPALQQVFASLQQLRGATAENPGAAIAFSLSNLKTHALTPMNSRIDVQE
ncbi:hypothetical protein [Chitinophaga vietnamensis]|uniref:hypothetical protein n=1 Tax=Chitinophaga vietnamensis TaxID=2593957 RepID=UPI001178AFD7|nr:hypothetical protein [Chitinophaga vietnamensis]